MSAAGFPIEGIKGGPSSVKTLQGLSTRCSRMPEIKPLCDAVVKRLQFLHESVAPLDANDPIKAKYNAIVVQFVKLLRRKSLLQRLASSETLVMSIREIQLKIGDVAQALRQQDDPKLIKWETEWDAHRAEQYGKLNELVTSASERMLVNEIKGDKKMKEAIMNLTSSAKWKGQPPEMVELKETTLSRVSSYYNQQGVHTFDWFISIDAVEYEDEVIGKQGTFGDVSRGTWKHDGISTEVVIKRLFNETSTSSDEAFLSQLELWSGLPDSEYILKLYGGSHVSSPQFYVCENAPNGNLAEFLAEEDNCVLFWRLFKQVALGLKFLHDNNTIHGGLKCNNILVGENNTTKLADFAFSTVRTLSAGLSGNAAKANTTSVRWKPKEVLEETGRDAPRFASDIYSLAMAMIEAKTQEIPFGFEDDEDVMKKIMSGEKYPRPEDVPMSDEEWAFISSMCEPDYKKRPSLDEVLKQISEFADAEEKHPVATELQYRTSRKAGVNSIGLDPMAAEDAPELCESDVKTDLAACPECDLVASSGDSFCRMCGFYLATDAVFA